jgi:hypothetical protein
MTSARGFAPIGWFDGNKAAQLVSYPFEGVSPPPSAAPPSKRWRDLILRVWHVDPLRCPVCNNHMRVIAVIDDPAVVRKIFRHPGLWHDPPPVRASPGQHECLLEPWLEDPMPDYENVLTD